MLEKKLSHCVGSYAARRRMTTPWLLMLAVLFVETAGGQISSRAYRVLGQPDLTRNGLNRLQGNELSGPVTIATDARGSRTRLYVADAGNHRILGWADTAAYQQGDAPVVVLGQFSPEGAGPMGVGETGFLSPGGLAVDPATGNLYVADTGNHRILRFPDPLARPSRIEPDAVYGQTDFAGRTAGGSGNPRNSLRSPGALTFDAAGNLWIADTGNHRVLRYPAATLASLSPAADLVLGQKDFESLGRNRTNSAITPGGFDSPGGIALDSEGNLYISDTNNCRVVRFTAPFTSDSVGSATFEVPAINRLTSLPAGIAISDRRLYAALPKEHRVIGFALSGGTAAMTVLGQPDLNSRDRNAGLHPQAAAYSLADPADVKSDPQGNLFVADTGNNRVLRFPRDSRSADRSWGQSDLSANGANQVKAGGLARPWKAAVDYTREPFALYVSDTMNHRILGWKDAVRFRSGDPADFVIGQPDLQTGIPNGNASGRKASASSLNTPKGIAVDPWGNLYVADSGNHRVLRFPRPVEQPGAVAADAVLGQPDFTTSDAGVPGPATLRSPSAVAVAADGTLFIADTGNNRVVEFTAAVFSGAPALRVYGQPGLTAAIAPRALSAQTLNQPGGLAVDAAFNLYVADTGSHRVLIYANTRDAAPASNSAAIVIGASAFDQATGGTGQQRLNGPADVALDTLGRVYVSDAQNNRVLMFPSVLFLPITDAAASAVIGQSGFTATGANWSARDASAPDGLAQPGGLFVDRRDTLYVADSGNHRMLHFLRGARAYHGAFRQASAVSPGAIVTIEGEGLADVEASVAPPLASVLAEREVVIDDTLRAPLFSIAPGSVRMQLPSTAATGTRRFALRVTGTAELIAGDTFPVAAYAPGLFTRVLNQDGAVNSDSAPAARGSTIRVYGTGQGPVSPLPADGEPASERSIVTVAVPAADSNSCLAQQPSVCVALGTGFGEVRFSGLAAGEVGTWEIDVKVPQTAPTGAVTLRAVINGVPSNIITVAIR